MGLLVHRETLLREQSLSFSLIGGQLLYNAVLVSAAQQEPATLPRAFPDSHQAL